jgi:hypothetical protein
MPAADDNNENRPNPLEKAQLRKLELEIDALERTAHEEKSVGISKQEKVKLEVKTLLWQTGRVYRLSQFAVIFSILATLVTIFATGYGMWSSYTKENETRVKERTDRTDGLYRTALERLIQFPVEPKLTISDAVFTLRDLEDVVTHNYDDEKKRERQKHEVGFLLAQLMNSPEVDLSVSRNVELDRKAMDQSSFYRDYLTRNPKFNRDIISKYKNVLSSVHDRAPCYSMVPDPNNKEVFIESECKNGEPEPTFLQYVSLYYGYKSHVAILGETLDKFPDVSQEAQSYRDMSFCWFLKATRNVPLTVEIFGGTREQVNWKWEVECPDK